MGFKDAVDTLLSNFQGMISKAIEAAPFDKTYKGRVVAVNGNKYSVQINGTIIEIKNNSVYAVGDYVDVLLPKNKWSNAVILGGASEGAVEAEVNRAKKAEADITSSVTNMWTTVHTW